MTNFSITLAFLLLSQLDSSAQTIRLSFDTPVMIFNNHVGNEWGFQLNVNNTPFQINSPVNINMSDLSDTHFVVFEANEKYPDRASTPLGIEPSSLVANK